MRVCHELCVRILLSLIEGHKQLNRFCRANAKHYFEQHIEQTDTYSRGTSQGVTPPSLWGIEIDDSTDVSAI